MIFERNREDQLLINCAKLDMIMHSALQVWPFLPPHSSGQNAGSWCWCWQRMWLQWHSGSFVTRSGLFKELCLLKLKFEILKPDLMKNARRNRFKEKVTLRHCCSQLSSVPRRALRSQEQFGHRFPWEECSAQTTDTGFTVFSRQEALQESSFPTPGPDELSKEGTEEKAALQVLGSHWAPQ